MDWFRFVFGILIALTCLPFLMYIGPSADCEQSKMMPQQ